MIQTFYDFFLIFRRIDKKRLCGFIKQIIKYFVYSFELFILNFWILFSVVVWSFIVEVVTDRNNQELIGLFGLFGFLVKNILQKDKTKTKWDVLIIFLMWNNHLRYLFYLISISNPIYLQNRINNKMILLRYKANNHHNICDNQICANIK